MRPFRRPRRGLILSSWPRRLNEARLPSTRKLEIRRCRKSRSNRERFSFARATIFARGRGWPGGGAWGGRSRWCLPSSPPLPALGKYASPSPADPFTNFACADAVPAAASDAKARAPTARAIRRPRKPSAGAVDQPLQLPRGPAELVGERAGAERAESGRERRVVPADVLGALAVAGPLLLTANVVAADHAAGVVELVGDRDQQGSLGCLVETRDVLLLAPAPRRPRLAVAVGALVDDVGNRVAVAPADVAQALNSALVLHRVVEQGGDRLVLRATVLDHEARDTQQVRDIGLIVASPELSVMGPCRVAQRVYESIPQLGGAGRGRLDGTSRLHSAQATVRRRGIARRFARRRAPRCERAGRLRAGSPPAAGRRVWWAGNAMDRPQTCPTPP